MKQRLLVSSIIMGLYASLAVGSAMAQNANDSSEEKKKETAQLQGVVVTGSLIPRAQIETASATISISSDTIKKEGFKNVYDALRSLPLSTGSVQDAQNTNTFSPSANTISLLGLNPGFTLVLMNGKPMADYPALYNGESNFVDLKTIPAYLIDRIDILPGNNSAVYGSSAIAGVVNIITKQKVEGVQLDYRVGGYTDGGGQQQRLTIAGGHSWGQLDAMFGLQLENVEPIWAYQRHYMDNSADNPTLHGAPPIAQRDRVYIDAFTGKYDAPDPAWCAAIGSLFKGDEKYHTRPSFGGYCGSTNGVGFTTISNGAKFLSANGALKYQLNDTTQLYGDLLYNVTKVNYLTGGTQFWGTTQGGGPAYVYDLDTKQLVRLQHIFAPEEIGSEADGKSLERSYIVNLGARGTLGTSDWNYDFNYHRSSVEADASRRRLLAKPAYAFFTGPQAGEDPYGYGYPAYHIVQNGKFWGAITPSEFHSISAPVRSESESYTQQLGATITNTDLFTLPAGSVGFAGVLEVGDQMLNIPIDPRIIANEFGGSGGTFTVKDSPTRNRQAAAMEFTAPVFSTLTANASVRYDRYSTGGNSQGKATYKLGLEFRPIDTLLLRATYGTAFRAPDMGQLYARTLFFTSAADVYNCRKAQGDDYKNCNPPYNSVQIKGFLGNDPTLKYITADSIGYGFVWSPTSNFNIKTDYYRIKVDNEIATYDITTILNREADCLLGHTRAGTPVDSNSALCKQFVTSVNRNPLNAQINPGGLNSVATLPVNIAKEEVSGIMASAMYKWEAGRYGDFTFSADYNTTLKHTSQQFPDDPVYDYLRERDYYSGTFKSIGSGTISWDIGAWSASVKGTRFGKTANWAGTGVTAPWMIYNASVQYNFNEDASMTLIANNVFNSRPPLDPTYSDYPYYNIYKYNGYGRLVMLQMSVHFGGGKN